MRKIVIVSIIVSILAGLGIFLKNFFGENDKGPVAPEFAKKKVIAFGDSLVRGYGVPENKNFVYLLSKRLGIQIDNQGKDGDNTESALKRLDQDVLSRNPDVVLVILGGNDFLGQMSKDETFKNLETIIDNIKSQGSKAVLVGIRGDLLQYNYEDQMKGLAEKKNVFYVPHVLDNILGEKKYMYDSIHPNEKGHEIMAERIAPVLKKAIEQ